MILVAVLWTAAESGQLLWVTLALVAVAGAGTGMYWVYSLAHERIVKANAHLIGQAMASTVSKKIEGGTIVIRHRSVVAQFIPDVAPPAPAQITAPVQRQIASVSPSVLRLIEATITHPEYGDEYIQLITQRDAVAAGVVTDPEWLAAVKEMVDKRIVYTGNQGTFFTADERAWTVYKRLVGAP